MTRVRANITSLDSYTREQATRFVVRGTVQAETELKKILGPQSGTRTGRAYKRGSKTHIASAPGEAPAVDSGRLRQSVFRTTPKASRKTVSATVGVATPYALALQVGTERMEARPFINRLAEQPHADTIFDQAVKALRK